MNNIINNLKLLNKEQNNEYDLLQINNDNDILQLTKSLEIVNVELNKQKLLNNDIKKEFNLKYMNIKNKLKVTEHSLSNLQNNITMIDNDLVEKNNVEKNLNDIIMHLEKLLDDSNKEINLIKNKLE